MSLNQVSSYMAVPPYTVGQADLSLLAIAAGVEIHLFMFDHTP